MTLEMFTLAGGPFNHKYLSWLFPHKGDFGVQKEYSCRWRGYNYDRIERAVEFAEKYVENTCLYFIEFNKMIAMICFRYRELTTAFQLLPTFGKVFNDNWWFV